MATIARYATIAATAQVVRAELAAVDVMRHCAGYATDVRRAADRPGCSSGAGRYGVDAPGSDRRLERHA